MSRKEDGFTKEFQQELQDRQCMLLPDEQYRLFQYARKIPKHGIYLELGSMFGGSLFCARKAIEIENNKVHLISLEVTVRDELRKMADGQDPVVTIINGRAENILPLLRDNSIDLILHDTDGHGEFLKKILGYCGRILKPDGVFIGHDYQIGDTSIGFIETKKTIIEYFGGSVKPIEGMTLYITNKKEIISAEKILE